MRDDSKSKANNVKTKAAKPTKLQELKAEAVEKARAKAKAKDGERVAANEAHRAAVYEADVAAGNIVEKSDEEWSDGGKKDRVHIPRGLSSAAKKEMRAALKRAGEM